MIDKKLLEQVEELGIEVDIELLRKKGLPDEVINDILEADIDEKLGNDENYIDFDEYRFKNQTLYKNKLYHV